jgi:hypothetical protein
MIRYVLAWFPMLALAIANGALRQWTFAKTLTEPQAHLLSTLLGSLAISVYIGFVIHRWPPSSRRQALIIGLVWVALTIAFESFMGLGLQHRTLAQVAHEYNLLAGRVWVLFLIWLGVAPWAFHTLRSKMT